MPEAVLLVDDDAPILRMLERTLAAEGYAVSAVPDGGAALAHVERSVPDAIVLDVAMPGLDGLAVTRRLRDKGLAVPILLLTARDALGERVAGLDAGADDYLVKPFAVEELTARVRALLRRNHPPGEQLAYADLALELATGAARRAGRDIELTRREAELLELLLRNARAVVPRELALERVWGGEAEASTNVVDQYVAYLRRKLGDPPLIHTVRGVGFRLQRGTRGSRLASPWPPPRPSCSPSRRWAPPCWRGSTTSSATGSTGRCGRGPPRSRGSPPRPRTCCWSRERSRAASAAAPCSSR